MSKDRPLWHGIILVAGGAVGAGMFALPMISSGAWMKWASLGLLLVWFLTYQAAKVLAKVNLSLSTQAGSGIGYESSFGSLVEVVLGRKWATVNNVSIVFIMMILMYAYISAGASIMSYSLSSVGIDVPEQARAWLSVSFATLIALVVWLGTSFVSQVSLVLMIAMALTFGIATAGLVPAVQWSTLVAKHTGAAAYLLSALPVYITAFACAGLVPSLVRHYSSKPKRVNQSLLWGTMLALLVYLFWLFVTLGTIGREGFVQIIGEGGNTGDLINALVNAGAGSSLQVRLSLFSHCAIVTSFMSIGLGLFHFIQDKLSLGKTSKQRCIAVLICFVPPAIGSFMMPYGFVHAIGYAGLFVAFSFFVVPGAMALAVPNGQARPWLAIGVIAFGVFIAALKVALIFELLPSFP